ncbi:MAG: sensor domain-containing diguanylate cyclase [Sporomusaceae bacterium]|nr:sensor domain-containing diguanylate cyclase [Sporomusaceae bacterium]
MRLFHKITLLLSLSIILTSFMQFIVFDKVFISDTDSLLLDINEQAANNMSSQLSDYFAKVEKNLRIIAEDESIRGSQELLDKANALMPEVDMIIITDQKGDMVRLSGNEYRPVFFNVSDRYYFKQVITGRTYISDVLKSVMNFKVITIAVPIMNNGQVTGAVIGSIKLDRSTFASLFDNKRFGRNGYIALLDRQGTIVYHPNKERIGQNTAYFDQLDHEEGAKMLTAPSETMQYVGYSKVPDLGWIVTVSTPTEDIVRSRNMLVYENLFLSLLGIIAIIVIGLYIAKGYTAALEQLIQSFSSLKKGNYKKLNPLDYAKEFRQMALVYNNTIETLAEIHTNLEEAADKDSLTGAYNRRAFDQELSRCQTDLCAESIGLLLLDIDYFKRLNDTDGHLVGDDILKKFTKIMQDIAGNQAVFRFGGDEFAIILRNFSKEELFALAETIRLSSQTSLNGCTVSIGLAKFPDDITSLDELVACADKALYLSKRSKNKVTLYSP